MISNSIIVKEIWIAVDKRYEVSSFGNVRSIDFNSGVDKKGRLRFKNGCTIRKVLNDNGYFVLNIKAFGVKKTWKVHQLVARAFIENPKKLPFINHKNGIRIDNRVENLEWCTPSHNNKHAYDVNKRKPVVNKGFLNGYSKIILDTNTGVFYGSSNEVCELYGINPSGFRAKLCGQNRNNTQFIYA